MTEQEEPFRPKPSDPGKKQPGRQEEGDEDAAEELGEILQNLREQLASLERKLGADVERTSEPKTDPKEGVKMAEPVRKKQDTLIWLSRFTLTGIIVSAVLTLAVVFKGPDVFPKTLYILMFAGVPVAGIWYIYEWWQWVTGE